MVHGAGFVRASRGFMDKGLKARAYELQESKGWKLL